VIAACTFCIWLALLSLPLTQSFVTSLLDIVESNLLVTRPVISACRFSLASTSLSLLLDGSLALDPLLPGTPGDYLGALSLGGSTYGASVPATRLVTRVFRLLPLFFFCVRYLSLLFQLRSLLLRLHLSLFFLSLFHFMYYADRNYASSSLPPVCNGINCWWHR
jgi:hypothetical protein